MTRSTTVNCSSQDIIPAGNIKEQPRRQGKKPPKKITEKYLYNSGLAYLQRFPASIPHFRRVMQRKIDKSCNYHKEQDKVACLTLLESTIAGFERQGLLNDDAYTQGMVNSLRRRGLSIKAIQYKLQQKGLSESTIRAAVAEFDEGMESGEAELSAALILTRKKRLGSFGTGEILDKHYGTLARAGFGFDIAQRALRLSREEAEDILSQRAL
jgi:regulatory protein